jgi:hypothetical protein
MPTARIAIEQTHAGWSAEIEAGGVMARCRTVRADRFDGIMRSVAEAYREMAEPAHAGVPAPDPATPPAAPAPAPIRLEPARRARGREDA